MKPRSNTVVITPPAAEPCTVAELMIQLGLTTPTDPALAAALAAQLGSLLLTARIEAENYTRRALMLQVQEMQLDRAPRGSESYNHDWGEGRAIFVPAPPLMAIVSLQFTDYTGTVQPVSYDPSLGTAANLPPYTYQRTLGTITQPGRVWPGRYSFWPCVGEGEAVVRLRFRCGYGGPVTVTTQTSTAVIESPFSFLPDDVGTAITIPGAGASAASLVTTIVSVDAEGNAMLAAVPAAVVSNATATLGQPVPEPIRRAIIKRAADHYTDNLTDAAWAFFTTLLSPYRNLIA